MTAAATKRLRNTHSAGEIWQQLVMNRANPPIEVDSSTHPSPMCPYARCYEMRHLLEFRNEARNGNYKYHKCLEKLTFADSSPWAMHVSLGWRWIDAEFISEIAGYVATAGVSSNRYLISTAARNETLIPISVPVVTNRCQLVLDEP
jgi:hypothetical protein